MKKLSKKFTALSLVLAIILSGLIVFGGLKKERAMAYSSDYSGDPDTIYYFTDFYPTIDATTLTATYGSNYNIVYDRQQITTGDFQTLVNSNYFSGFGTNCIVIIDIKTFMPEPGDLHTLFAHLKNVEGCKTVFVTVYDDIDYIDTSFVQYLDTYYKSDFSKLELFIEEMLYTLVYDNGTLEDTIILIDGNIVNVATYNSHEDSFNQLCNTSIFLSFLMEKFADSLNILYSNYWEIISWLNINLNVKLIVHNGGIDYVDLYDTNYTYSVACVEDLMEELENNNSTTYNYICGVGFWALDSDFYNFLYAGQLSLGNLPVFILEVDPITWGSGLSIRGVLNSPEEEELLGELTYVI